MKKIIGHQANFYVVIAFIWKYLGKINRMAHFDWFLYKKSLNICETLLYYYPDINQKETVKKIIGHWSYFCVMTGFYTP